VAELVDAHDSKSCGATHEGSIPSPGTILRSLEQKNVLRSFSEEGLIVLVCVVIIKRATNGIL
jgi:hypothetical protein